LSAGAVEPVPWLSWVICGGGSTRSASLGTEAQPPRASSKAARAAETGRKAGRCWAGCRAVVGVIGRCSSTGQARRLPRLDLARRLHEPAQRRPQPPVHSAIRLRCRTSAMLEGHAGRPCWCQGMHRRSWTADSSLSATPSLAMCRSPCSLLKCTAQSGISMPLPRASESVDRVCRPGKPGGAR
jgi:hypothetical protein